MRRPQISLKALLWLILVVACFFSGIHFERDRRRREDEAAALAAAEEEVRARISRELFLQEQKVDQLMVRFNALMDEERDRDAEAFADIAEQGDLRKAGMRGAELTARMLGGAALTARRQPLILPPLPPLLPCDALKSRQTEASAD